MKRLPFIVTIATASLLVTSTIVFAEDEKPEAPASGARAPGERLKALTEKLGLTEEQQGKIKDIFAKNMPNAKALREDTALSQEDRRAKMMELRKAEAEEIRAVLTPEQQEKMKEMRKAAKPAK